MNRTELEQLVNLVTQQVLSAMQGEEDCPCPATQGMSRALVIGGGAERIPQELRHNFLLLDTQDYETHQNVLRYDRVIITALTFSQLADIALGRAGDPSSCAVIRALLEGIDVFMLENSLPFRAYSGKGSTALYHLLEGYAQTLQIFGVKLYKHKTVPELPEAKPPKYQAPAVEVPLGTAVPNANRLVTEAAALAMVKQGSPLRIPSSSILTPSARDVFSQAGITLILEDPV